MNPSLSQLHAETRIDELKRSADRHRIGARAGTKRTALFARVTSRRRRLASVPAHATA
jgi:hypothetical protein